jgi:histidine triad (HIT) family protein
MAQAPDCVFCLIIMRQEPARIRYEDEDVLVFDNVLTWVPVMLLAVPKQHLYQEDFWESPLLCKVGAAAMRVGSQLCPGGYRLLSNVGRHARQSQAHAHLHVLGGTDLGLYA